MFRCYGLFRHVVGTIDDPGGPNQIQNIEILCVRSTRGEAAM